MRKISNCLRLFEGMLRKVKVLEVYHVILELGHKNCVAKILCLFLSVSIFHISTYRQASLCCTMYAYGCYLTNGPKTLSLLQ
uniref:Uncharacterized protein n=1 Tax=Rhizophora mucronata TaxID=61149 RepID=A0A2P2QQ27_RHIMU